MAEPEGIDFTDLIENWVVVRELTLSNDANAYAANDVFAPTQKLENVVPVDGGAGVIYSIAVIDENDQGLELDFYFFDGNVPIGTVNQAVTLSAANAAYYVGHATISTYEDLINSKCAFGSNLGIGFQCGPESRHLYVGTVTRAIRTTPVGKVKIKVTILPAK